MKNKWFIILITLITIVNLVALGTIIYHHYMPRSSNINCMKDSTSNYCCIIRQHLNITEEQASKLNEVENLSRSIIDTLSLRMKEVRIELVQELMKESTDTLQIEKELRQVDSLQTAIQRNIIHRLLNEKGILTPSQQEKFFSLVLGQYCMEIDSLKQIQCQKQQNSMKGVKQ